jgi:very-short-patch-repair endonuclease
MVDARVRFAKDLRSGMTDAERKLWLQLRAHRFQGYKFRRQQPIGSYIADFVCFDARLIIEVDGGQHLESARDAKRDEWFLKNGFRVLRFWNNQVLQETEGVLQTILLALKDTPLPNPSPARGEGLEP